MLIVRPAEKAERGPGLSPAGEPRARAYARYFRPFPLGPERLRVDTLIAAADSHRSQRSRLTLEPLSRASGVPIQQPFDDRDVGDLAAWLGQGAPGRTILIAWHHSELPRLMRDLGLDPSAALPGRNWPPDVYDWVVVLRFDRSGAIMPESCRLIREPTLLG
ncbi:MAG: flagellar basal body-associated protein FliL [Proteobacteria bacterium]|nr:flagellar basal body-associated protein FliL [Pseudomonadota bacterium]